MGDETTASSRERVFLPLLSCWKRGGSSESGREEVDEEFLVVFRRKDLGVE